MSDAPKTPTDKGPPSFVDQIVEKMTSLFGNDKQAFVMEWPGRVLDKSTYKYEVKDSYSVLSKPQTVAEAEFRLSDSLFDVPDVDEHGKWKGVTGGPNGRMLSTSFREALSTLVPSTVDLPEFTSDQQTIRAWLEKEVEYTINDGKEAQMRATTAIPDLKKHRQSGGNKSVNSKSNTDDGDTGISVKMPRMQLYKVLNDQYVAAKAEWEETKHTKLQAAMNATPEDKVKEMENYARFVAHEAPVVEARLEALFAELVVKGYYHSVRAQLGFLDVDQEAELLADVRKNMRASAMSSLDESEKIYPVAMQPEDWFEALDTNFTPVDLLKDPALIADEIRTQQEQLNSLTTQLALLDADKQGDVNELKAAVTAARDALDKAHSDMQSKYSAAALDLVEMYYAHKNKKGGGAGDEKDDQAFEHQFEAVSGGSKSKGPTKEEIEAIKNMQNTAIQANEDLTRASRAYATAQADLAGAKVTDPTSAKEVLNQRIRDIQANIASLKASVMQDNNLATAALTGKMPTDSTNPDGDNQPYQLPIFNTLPTGPPPVGASRFMDVVLSVKTGAQTKDSKLHTQASHTQGGGSLLFCGGGWSKSESSATSDDNFADDKAEFDVGFRATKVTINRGGWFDPLVLAKTKAMQKISEDRVSFGPTSPAVKSSDAMKGLLPAYPVSFVIAKDVTIKIKIDKTKSSKLDSTMDKASSWQVGFLCFSASHSETSHDESHSFHYATSDEHLVIKIPAPQIIGWFLEWVPVDEASGPYKKMASGYLPVDVPAEGIDDHLEGRRTADKADSGSRGPVSPLAMPTVPVANGAAPGKPGAPMATAHVAPMANGIAPSKVGAPIANGPTHPNGQVPYVRS